MCKSVLLSVLAIVFLTTTAAYGTTVLFDFAGKAGPGLIAGNQNGTVLGTPGSGGELGAGITYDDVTNILSINAGWGSGNGFTNLTGNATAGHLHGPTSPAPAGYTQDAGVDVGLDDKPGWNASATNGGFNGTVTLSALQETRLLAQEYYMNVHTGTNSGGEIRGHLIIVPEPTSACLLLAGSGLFLRRNRRVTK